MRTASVASATFMRKSMRSRMICATIVMMREPPGDPSQARARHHETPWSAPSKRAVACGRGRIRRPSDKAVSIGSAGLRRKIIEFVVEQDARPLGDEAEAIRKIQRICVRDRITLGVDNREMRCLIALIRGQIERLDGGGRPRPLGRDLRAQPRRIGFRDESLHRIDAWSGSPRYSARSA